MQRSGGTPDISAGVSLLLWCLTRCGDANDEVTHHWGSGLCRLVAARAGGFVVAVRAGVFVVAVRAGGFVVAVRAGGFVVAVRAGGLVVAALVRKLSRLSTGL